MDGLRFRLWDKRDNSIMSPDRAWGCGFGLDINGDVICYYDDDPDSIEYLIAEQYTGLRDKNDNQWCEEDILGATDRDDSSRCIIKRDEVGFYRQGIRLDYQVRLEKNDVDFWVKVGNTHENPELLI